MPSNGLAHDPRSCKSVPAFCIGQKCRPNHMATLQIPVYSLLALTSNTSFAALLAGAIPLLQYYPKIPITEED